MKLGKQQVKHIAKLARLELTAEEENKFPGQLSSILEYVEKLKEVDTNGVEPTSQVTGLENSIRDDTIEEISEKAREGILDSAPDKDGELFKVKSVFE